MHCILYTVNHVKTKIKEKTKKKKLMIRITNLQ